jgi:TfoX/Sxy family transcriptional regulator of competence genes
MPFSIWIAPNAQLKIGEARQFFKFMLYKKILMSSNQDFVDFVIGQLQSAGEISFKKMFGEYALYSGNKIFALICDNRLFIKPTIAGKNYIQDVVEAPPYPGAKPSFLIEDRIEDHEWLSTLVKLTVNELPEPKPKKKKKNK